MERVYHHISKIDPVDEKVFMLLQTGGEAEPRITVPLATVNNAEVLTIAMTGVKTLVSSTEYQYEPHQSVSHLHRFMKVLMVDYVRESLKESFE